MSRLAVCECFTAARRAVRDMSVSSGLDLSLRFGFWWRLVSVCVSVSLCVCFRLLGNFWPPARQTEIKLRFSSVRGQLVSRWSLTSV